MSTQQVLPTVRLDSEKDRKLISRLAALRKQAKHELPGFISQELKAALVRGWDLPPHRELVATLDDFREVVRDELQRVSLTASSMEEPQLEEATDRLLALLNSTGQDQWEQKDD